MTTFTSDDREEEYKKILAAAPNQPGYEDAVPIYSSKDIKAIEKGLDFYKQLKGGNASPPHIVDSGASVMNKPVAYINVEERKLEWATPMTWHTPTIAKMDKIPLYTKPNDEPAAWFYYRPGETGTFMCGDAEAMKGIEKDGWVTTPLYTHPADLTDEEIVKLHEETSFFGVLDPVKFARAILRKAQEK